MNFGRDSSQTQLTWPYPPPHDNIVDLLYDDFSYTSELDVHHVPVPPLDNLENAPWHHPAWQPSPLASSPISSSSAISSGESLVV